MEEVCNERVQKSNVRCNSDSIERVTQQFDSKKEIGEMIRRKPLDHIFEKSCVWNHLRCARRTPYRNVKTALCKASNWGG